MSKACVETGSTSVTGSQPWRWTALSSTSQNCQSAATQQQAAVQAASLHGTGALGAAGPATAAPQHLAAPAQPAVNYAAQVS